MRAVRLGVGAALVAATVTGVPAAHAWLPGYCGLVPSQVGLGALVGVDPRGPDRTAAAVRGYGGTVVGRVPALGVVEVRFASTAARDTAVRALPAAPGVTFAEAEYAVHATARPNDPYLHQQWGLTKIAAPRAWDRDTGRRNAVTVAVIDTGVDLGHPDLAGRVVDGPNVENGLSGSSQDDQGHGTHVAGIIAAATNNRKGVAGVSWGAKILAVKVLSAQGAGTDCDVAVGIVEAAYNGAKVLNMSLGAAGAPCGLAMQKAIDYAGQQNAVTVVASGNEAMAGNPVSSPADCAGVLAVGATDGWDRIARFSSHQPYVGISAPGVNILSTYYDAKHHKHVYAYASGTSMATPFVSGVVALLRSEHPDWTPAQVRDRIVSSSDDLGVRGRDPFFGAGRVNAARALS